MKRCSQCEFIYEDDQSVCDMDGQALIHDLGLSISPVQSLALTRKAAPGTKTSSLQGIALPAGVGLLLAALFSVGFFVSSANPEHEPDVVQAVQQKLDVQLQVENSLPSSVQSGVSAQEAEPTRSPDVETIDTTALPARPNTVDRKSQRASVDGVDPRFLISRGLPSLPRVRPLPRLPNAKPLETRPTNARITKTSVTTPTQKPTSATDPSLRKGSKVSSFLKKTGRILSKPFKL